MADISKCNDTSCPSKNKCLRYTIPASEFWQAYTNFNRNADEQNCNFFIKNEENDTTTKDKQDS